MAVGGAGIDKLNAIFTQPLRIEDIHEHCLLFACFVTQRYLKDRNLYLEISHGDQYIHLRLTRDRAYAVNMLTNPNRFGSWEVYLEFIQNILTPTVIQSAQISRLDLNLDFACSFQDLIQSVDVKNKKWGAHFVDQAGERTGLILGKGAETIEIYDKSRKSNLPTPQTRLELRLSGRKLPTHKISEVPRVVKQTPLFKGVEGSSLTISSEGVTDAQASRLNEFKLILKREGLHVAKKSMNQDRNFERNFAKLIEIKKWDLQPSQLYQDAIQGFFHTIKGGLLALY